MIIIIFFSIALYLEKSSIIQPYYSTRPTAWSHFDLLQDYVCSGFVLCQTANSSIQLTHSLAICCQTQLKELTEGMVNIDMLKFVCLLRPNIIMSPGIGVMDKMISYVVCSMQLRTSTLSSSISTGLIKYKSPA